MVKELLQTAAIPARSSRYPDPPAGTYAVYFDSVEAGGADGLNFIYTHDVMVELYEAKQDDAAEAAFEAALNAQGIPWTKQPRYWLDDTRRYQTVYEFTHYEKRRA